MTAEWVDTRQITLGFDHAHILADAQAKVAKRLGDDLDLDFPEGGRQDGAFESSRTRYSS